MRQTLQYAIFLIITLFTFASCRTVKELRNSRYKDKGEQAILRRLLAEPEQPELTSALTISTADLTLSGQLRMRWNRSIQISANMMGLMEIARIEFLPDHLLIIDRTGRRYCKAPYSQIPYLSSMGVDFYTLQSLFWSRAFAPGNPELRQALDHIRPVADTESQTIYTSGHNSPMDPYLCTFTVSDSGELVKTRIAATLAAALYTLDFSYGSIEKLKEGNTFPTAWNITLRTVAWEAPINVTLRNLSVQPRDWADETAVGSRYRQVTIEELLEEIK